MPLARSRALIILSITALVPVATASVLIAKPKVQKPQNSATSGLKTLSVSGTPHERGYAHGRIYAREIIELLDGFIKAKRLSGGREGYEATSLRIPELMQIPPLYLAEMKGIFEGMREATGGKMKVAGLQRDLKFEDIIVMNCLADLSAFGCSSFGAWGSLTKRGETLSGRNLDWFYMPEMARSQILMVQAPDEKNKRAGWVTMTWPGQVGCFTAMNEHGVTIAMHDVEAAPPAQSGKFTPRSLILRDAIETARADNAESDIFAVLKKHKVAVGNNLPVSVPFREGSKIAPFMIFEYDARGPSATPIQLNQAARMETGARALAAASQNPGRNYGVCTNHYCSLDGSPRCWRFEKLNKVLSDRAERNQPLTAIDAERLLDEAAVTPTRKYEGILTYHSVIFEPNRLIMQIALCRGKTPATKGPWNEVNVGRLLAAD